MADGLSQVSKDDIIERSLPTSGPPIPITGASGADDQGLGG
jgi:hypothetical protein